MDEHGRIRGVPALLREHREELLFQRPPQLTLVERILGLGVDVDPTPGMSGHRPLGEIDDFLKCRHRVQAVVLLAARGDGLPDPQGLHLGGREIADVPVGPRGDAVDHACRPAGSEFRVFRDIRGIA